MEQRLYREHGITGKRTTIIPAYALLFRRHARNDAARTLRAFAAAAAAAAAALSLLCAPPQVCAQNASELVDAGKRIMDAKDNVALYEAFESAKAAYVKEHKYTELTEFLSSLARKKKSLGAYADYYIALARYLQLRHLEDKQAWDEYFRDGNIYRDEVARGTDAAIKGSPGTDPVHIYARTLLWQFQKDQQDPDADDALAALMKAAEAYVKGNGTVVPIKDAADKLMAYGERGRARELYRMYVGKVITTTTPNEEIKGIADGFLRDGNADLAQSLFDIYFTRLANGPKDVLTAELKKTAPMFAYGEGANRDPAFAEKLFKRLEETAGEDAFDAELLYLRALNAEKARDMEAARDAYRSLNKRFPQSPRAYEAAYKAALITVYALKDMAEGRTMLKSLAGKEAASAQSVAALYQLGLLSHWQQEVAPARDYYERAAAKAGTEFSETAELARRRLKELDEESGIEDGLKKFLAAALGNVTLPRALETGITELKSEPSLARRNQDVKVSALSAVGATGCFQVDMSYLWSGHLGTASPPVSAAAFTTTYKHAGTKEVNLVVVSSTGTVDYSFVFVDIQ